VALTASHHLLRRGEPRRRRLRLNLWAEEVIGLEEGEEEVVDCVVEVCREEVVVRRGGS
jgi:hypothetical protein